jgi:GDP-L-fucose synthase
MDGLSGARVLVTGATGFVGAHVAATLEAAGAKVSGIGSTYDLRNEAEVLSAFLLVRPDIVVHLASSRAEALREDLLMGLNVTHAAALSKAKVVTLLPADVYPEGAPLPLKEEGLWASGPVRSTAKRALIEILDANLRDRGTPYACLVAPEIYGPGRSSRGGIAGLVVAQIVQGARHEVKEVGVGFKGDQEIPLLHVTDAAAAVAAACVAKPAGVLLNIANGTVSIESLVSGVARLSGYKGKIAWGERLLEGPFMRALDASRAGEILGWKSVVGLEDGLKQIVEWHARAENNQK